jgi:S-adenosyl-L-methionine hydrolase (adenosine-forming)
VGYDCMTLCTDYGYEAGFVGVLHAVAFAIAPRLPVIDLDHSVPPQNVRLGALRLERVLRFVPPGAHVAVVDPGVGGSRRAVAVESGDRVFIGPDNGLLPWAVEASGGSDRAVLLDREQFWLSGRSRTFDGRDIFVPVAAHLCAGTDLLDVGTEIDPSGLISLERPRVTWIRDDTVELEAIQVDGFGNVQLYADAGVSDALGLSGGLFARVTTAAGHAYWARFGETFAVVDRGELVMLVDSDGCLALSVNSGRADTVLGVAQGDILRIRGGGAWA